MAAHNAVHVWYATLDVSPADLTIYESLLSGYEHVRASRFRFDRDRWRFVAARGILRQLLSRYVGHKPWQLRIECNAFGKPFLRSQPINGQICFNLAHSQDMALYGIALDCEIGVDIECIRPVADYLKVAEYLFSSQEFVGISALDKEARLEAFFNCWTQKEAYVKAQGTGMRTRLDSFNVSLNPRNDPAPLKVSDDRWLIFPLRLIPGYAASIAMEGTRQIEARKWSLRPSVDGAPPV